MKKLNDTLYVIEPGLYAELLTDGTWVVSDEKSTHVAGPFATLEELERSRMDAGGDVPPALTVVTNTTGTPEVAVTALEAEDLVTLTEAAASLPVTRQALYAAAKRGTLPVEPVVVGRQTKLYSLKALKEAYSS